MHCFPKPVSIHILLATVTAAVLYHWLSRSLVADTFAVLKKSILVGGMFSIVLFFWKK